MAETGDTAAASDAEHDRLVQALADKARELDSIVYVASHDLRSPLVNIQGFGQELVRAIGEIRQALASATSLEALRAQLNPLLESDIAESLHFIETSAAKMDRLISGLLRLSRLGRTPLRPETLDMNLIARRVLATFRPQVEQAEASVTVEHLPPCTGDEQLIVQMLSALLDNALQYRDPNRPLHVRFTGSGTAESVLYCIEDNGVGIPPQHQQRVFELFHRLQPDRCPGEGLGLTIAQRIASRHGGKLWVDSESGRGSKFFLALPPPDSRGAPRHETSHHDFVGRR